MFVCEFVSEFVCLFACLFVCLFVCLFCLFVLAIYPSIYLCMYLSVYLSGKRHLHVKKDLRPAVFSLLPSTCASRHNGVHFFGHVDVQKVVRMCDVLTWKCASGQNGVHFFGISTSKSGPILVCFVHFDFDMCFVPQRRDISTSKSGPDLQCFEHFDLDMCFAPQRRAIFHLSPGQLAPHPPL